MGNSVPSATWTPVENQTATWRIFHKKWMVRVPTFQARTLEDVEHFGVPTSGERDYDRAMLNERKLTYLTINEMIELFKRDVTVGIFNVKDAALMYDDVSEHLRMWERTLWGSRNVKADPAVLEDLIHIDKFAQAMWPHAEPILNRDFFDSELFAAFGAVGGSLALPMASFTEEPAPMPTPDAPYTVPERESFEDVFARRRKVSTSWNGE